MYYPIAMAWQYSPYTPILTLATIVGIVVTAIAWSKRSDPAARWAAYVNCSIAAWAALHLVTVTSTIYEVKLYSFSVAIANICLLAVLALGYVLRYTGRQAWLTRRRLGALLGLPLSLIVLLVTDGTRELVLADPHLDSSAAGVQLRYTWGPLWIAYASACYVIDAVSLGLLAQKFKRSRNVYRKITLAIFVAVLIPVVGTMVSFSGRSPFPHFVLVPHLVIFTSALVVLTMTSITVVRMIPLDRLLTPFRSRFGSLVPLARDVVVEDVDNGIVVLDTDGRIVDINSTAKKMIGADHPIGKHVADAARTDFILTPDFDVEAMIDSPADIDGSRYEIWVSPGTDEYCYEIQFTVIEADGEPAGIVIIIHDITDQKNREEKLRDREQELERQKANLQSQTRQLEHQNERLDEFASIVSHDLRNPLNVADGYLEMIETAARADDEDVDPASVAEVRHATDRMQSIIEDALSLARQGQAVTETEPVSIRDVATDAWSNVETGAATLEFEFGPERDDERSEAADGTVTDELFVEADRTRLLTVFENLFRNAVEHGSTNHSEPDGSEDAVEHGSTDPVPQTQQGAVEPGSDEETVASVPTGGDERGVTVTVGRLEDGSGFYVADDGPGIPADRREEVLEQGYSTNSEGTGLGLSIVQNVVKAHGWDLRVAESECGGARFEIDGVASAASESVGDRTDH